MKKITVLSMVLLLMGMVAVAQANIINPYTLQPLNNLLDGVVVDENPFFYLVDNMESDGWLANGSGKYFHFAANFDPGQEGFLVLGLAYFSRNTDTLPPLPIIDGNGLQNSNNNGHGEWVGLGARVIGLNEGNLIDSIDMSAQITGFQPRWDAVFVLSNSGFIVNSLDLETYCKPTPIPGSLLLLGSGILGLVGIGFRRKSA
jgi:hypothetical protein